MTALIHWPVLLPSRLILLRALCWAEPGQAFWSWGRGVLRGISLARGRAGAEEAQERHWEQISQSS